MKIIDGCGILLEFRLEFLLEKQLASPNCNKITVQVMSLSPEKSRNARRLVTEKWTHSVYKVTFTVHAVLDPLSHVQRDGTILHKTITLFL